MLGVDAISESPLSSSGTDIFSNIYIIEDMSMATFEVVTDEDGVLITNLISVVDHARCFKDWEKISTGEASNWSAYRAAGDAGWKDARTDLESHWTKIRASGSAQWKSIENNQSVDWHGVQDTKRNKS